MYSIRNKMVKSVMHFGKITAYKNIVDATNKNIIEYKNDNNLTKKENKDMKKNMTNTYINLIKKERVIHDNVSGEIEKVNITQPPLIIREFTNRQRISKAIKSKIGIYDQVQITPNVEIHNKSIPFNNTDILRLNVKVDFRIIISGTCEKKTRPFRKLEFIYKGAIGDKKYLEFPKSRFIIKIASDRRPNQMIRNYTGVSIHDEFFYTNRKSRENEICDMDNTIYDFNPDDIYPEGYDRFHPPLQDEIKNINFDTMGGLQKEIINRILLDYGMCYFIVITDLQFSTVGKKEKFNISTMKMYSVVYDDITTNIYNEVVKLKNDDKNCVYTILDYMYSKKSPKSKGINILKYFKDVDINVDEGITAEQVTAFCEYYNIKTIAYNYEGDVISSFYPTKETKTYKKLVYISYNSHMYLIKNRYIKQSNYIYDNVINNETGEIKKQQIIYNNVKNMSQDTINTNFNELLNNRIIPANIKISAGSDCVNIITYINDKCLYFINDDYNDCLQILTVYGMQDKMTPHINRYNIFNKVFEKLYKIPSYGSFFPQLKNYRQGGYRFMTTKKYNEKDILCIDKNKSYPWALHELDYILTVDIRTAIIIKNPTTEINKYYFYIVQPKVSSVLLPCTGYYTGYFLLYCKSQGLDFVLLYEIEAQRHDNKCKEMLKEYYKKTASLKLNDEYIIKSIVNIWIGNFDKGCDQVKNILSCNKVCNNDEVQYSDNTIKYNDNYSLSMKESTSINIYTRKLLNIQIKNKSRMVLYEKMKELKLNDDNIIKIETDAIAFIDNRTTKKKLIKSLELNETLFSGWKENIFHTINDGFSYSDDKIKLNEKEGNTNILYEGYAGCGKSTMIKEFINTLNKNETYRILSPNHNVIREYRKMGLICDVIQKYEYMELPKEHIIIIDEIGLCDKTANDTIYKCHLDNKQIMAYGDFRQLKPVNGEPCNSSYYLNMLYGNRYKLTTNYRNNFTNEYYDDLINEKINLIDELKKWNTSDYKKADIIICYTNAKCDIYNKKMLKHLKLKFGDIGCKVLCKTNKLNKYELFNNFILTITDITEKYIILDEYIKIPIKLFYGSDKGKPNFKPAYARTVYNVQGDEFKSYYIDDEDIKNHFNNGRTAYTIISRLIQDRPQINNIIVKSKKNIILDINSLIDYNPF